jgi:predicted transcriptional regulator
MAFTFIKFPKKFLDSEEWQKPRKYSKAEALLDILYDTRSHSIGDLARRWQWSKSTVHTFLRDMEENGFSERLPNGLPNDCRTIHIIRDKENPPILSTTNVVSNIIPPRGEENTDFIRFNEWVNDNAPRVAKMKEPFTAEQVAALKTDFEITFICDLLKAMHNYQPLLTKNRNAYLTFRNWARRETQKTNDTKRTTNTPSNDPKSRLEGVLRAAAEGISRANTPQEW